MKVLRYTTLVLALACYGTAQAQQQVDGHVDTTQTREERQGNRDTRRDRVENRREQMSQNRELRQENREIRQAERSRDNQNNDIDQFIATCLLIGNQEEVAVAQMAVDRAENENVRQFAQMLVDDHQKAIQKLEQHAKRGMGLDRSIDATTSTGSANSDQYAANESSTAQRYTARRVDLDQDSASSGSLDQVLSMQRQAAEQCLSMTKSMMQEKQGAEFDKAFAGSQIGAHVGMLAKLKASQQHASGELASIIQESEQVVQSHLEQAKQLCQELESQQASNR